MLHRPFAAALRCTLLAALALAIPACNEVRWSDGERAEAVRICRGQFGFPPISVFESQEVTYVRFMCQCEVDWLSERVPHRKFEDRLRADEVNRVLAAGGVYCLQQMKAQGIH